MEGDEYQGPVECFMNLHRAGTTGAFEEESEFPRLPPRWHQESGWCKTYRLVAVFTGTLIFYYLQQVGCFPLLSAGWLFGLLAAVPHKYDTHFYKT